MNFPFKKKAAADTPSAADKKNPSAAPVGLLDKKPEGAAAALPKGKEGAKKKKYIKRGVAGALVVCIAGVGVSRLLVAGPENAVAAADEAAVRRDIQNVLSATGTLEPLDQYAVTSLASGGVITCTFNEGDYVEKDQLLYQIDSSDAESSIERSEISLKQSQLSYNQQLESIADLTVTSGKSGVITSVEVSVGDSVQAGAAIAHVRDSATMLLKIPFNESDANSFYVGQSAVVTMDGSFETLSGRVTEIDGASSVLDGYQIIKNVTIAVSNPGALSPASAASATINGIACNSGAYFEYNEESVITADVSGKVASLSISSGSVVSAGQTVAKLTSTSLENSLENAALSLQSAELSLQNAIDALDDYNIYAPISGTVVTKNTKIGDSITSSSGVSSLAVIYDLSALKFDIALDELDISLVEVGQSVEITVDALDGELFYGNITNISVAGTTSNGATTYPVTVQIDNPPSELLPGMNINASIIVEEANDVIAIPVDAVQRGNIVYVKDTGSADAGTPATSSDPSGEENDAEPFAGGALPDGLSAGDSLPDSLPTPPAGNVPDGYRAVSVETGITDGSYIEIIRGISEGDIVYTTAASRVSSDSVGFDMGGGMPGGGGGAMPSGGGGGMPSGGGGAPGGGMP